MSRTKPIRCKLLVSLLCLTFIGVNIGCSTQSPVSPSASAVKSPVSDEAPKGPGAVNLTATARTAQQPTECQALARETPPITDKWPIYKDTRFSFQFSFPPGWRAGATTNTSADGISSSYIVQVFPPTSQAPFDWHSSLFDIDHFEVTVFLTGPVTSLANDSSYIPENTAVSIGGIQSTLYDRTSADCQEIERFAQAEHNHSQYQFRLKSIPTKARQDISLFLGMLQSFNW